MRFKWIIAIAFALLAASVAAILLFVSTYDYNRLKPEIAKAVKNATGRELILGGEIELDVGFSPKLSVEDVRFQNAPWGSRPDLARIKTIQLQVALLPLVSRHIKIQKLILLNPDILLETDKAGNWNVRFHGEKKVETKDTIKETKERSEQAFPLFSFHELRIEGGRITYRDGRRHRTYSLDLLRLTANAMNQTSPVHLSSKGTFQGSPFEIRGGFGSLIALIDPKAVAPIHLNAKAFGADLELEGEVRDLLHAKGFTLMLHAKVPSMKPLGVFPWVNKLPDLSPIHVALKAADTEGRLAIENMDLRLGKAEQVSLSLKGSVKDVLSKVGMDVRFAGKGRALSQLHARLGEVVPFKGPFKISGHLRDPATKTYEVSDLRIGVGKNDLAGSLGLSLAGKRPKIKAVFASEYLDMRPFFPKKRKKGKKKASFLTMVKKRKMGFMPPMVMGYLNGADADVKLEAKRVLLPRLTLRELAGHACLQEGMLKINQLEARVFRKRERVKVALSGAIKDLNSFSDLDCKFGLRGTDLKNLKPWFNQAALIRGPFHITGRLKIPDHRTYQFSNLGIFVGKSDLGGSIDLSFKQKRPLLTASLSSKRLDLRPLLSKKRKRAKAGKSGSSHVKQGRVLPADPLPLEVLKRFDTNTTFWAGKILLPKLAFKDIKGSVQLKGGNLTIKNVKGMIGGGRVSGYLALGAHKRRPSLSTEIKIKHMQTGVMLRDLEIDEIIDGDLDVDINLRGSGQSVAALSAGLNGRVSLVMGKSRLNKKAIKALGGDMGATFLNLLDPFSEKAECTEMNCFVGRFRIQDGIAKTFPLVLDGKNMTMLGDGELNLKTEEIDFTIKPSPKGGVGIKGIAKLTLSLGELAKPLLLSGTLANPSFTLDPTHTLITLGKALGGFLLFGPFGIAAILASGSIGDENPCLAAIEAAEKRFEEYKQEEQRRERGDLPGETEKKSKGSSKKTEGIGSLFKKLFSK